ncbi:MAG: PEP-CTERM sorting domain-containing protein [Heteroscytonema crispum UTEX LB 1556]
MHHFNGSIRRRHSELIDVKAVPESATVFGVLGFGAMLLKCRRRSHS